MNIEACIEAVHATHVRRVKANKQVWLTFKFIYPGRHTILEPSTVTDAESKDKILFRVLDHITTTHPIGVFSFYESWISKKEDCLPMNDPDRQEGVIYQLETPDLSTMWCAPIVVEKGKRRLLEATQGGDGGHGLFSDLYKQALSFTFYDNKEATR